MAPARLRPGPPARRSAVGVNATTRHPPPHVMLPIQSDRPQPDLPPYRPPLDPRRTRRPLRWRPTAAADCCSARWLTPRRSVRSPSSRPRSRPPPRSASPSTSFTPYPRARWQSSRRTLRHRRDQRGRRPAPLPPSARTRRPRSRLHRRRVAAGHLRRGGAAARVLTAGPRSTVRRPADPGGSALAVKLDRLPRRGLSRTPCGPRRHARSPARRVRVRRRRPHALRIARGIALKPRAAYATPRRVPPAPSRSPNPACGEMQGSSGLLMTSASSRIWAQTRAQAHPPCPSPRCRARHGTAAQTDATPMQRSPASACRGPALTRWDLGRLHSSGHRRGRAGSGSLLRRQLDRERSGTSRATAIARARAASTLESGPAVTHPSSRSPRTPTGSRASTRATPGSTPSQPASSGAERRLQRSGSRVGTLTAKGVEIFQRDAARAGRTG